MKTHKRFLLTVISIALAFTFPGCFSDSGGNLVVACEAHNAETQFCDERDGKIYKWKLIGDQTWMAENLNYAAEGSRCYGDNTGGDSQNRCDTYGRLYNWATAMDIAVTYNSTSYIATLPHQGVCPNGWHLPSDAEWTALTIAVGADPGKQLKATSGWTGTPGNGTDDYGFSALPGGGGYYSGGSYYYDKNEKIPYYDYYRYNMVVNRGLWWSSTQNNASNAYARTMTGISSNVTSEGDSYKGSYYNVRCVQN
jgi:uncharacterized protein (TIGR02145 family)